MASLVARQPPSPPKTPLRPLDRAKPPPAAPATKETTRAPGHACGSTAGHHVEMVRREQQRGKNTGDTMVVEEDQRGQVASSLDIYMKDLVEVTKLQMGRSTTCYDWIVDTRALGWDGMEVWDPTCKGFFSGDVGTLCYHWRECLVGGCESYPRDFVVSVGGWGSLTPARVCSLFLILGGSFRGRD